MKRILGITGGIGSGKSYVSRMLTSLYHIPVYDCDSEAKRLNEESPLIRQALIKLVGTQVYGDDGHLCKDILATYLFQSEVHQEQINGIIHPIVKEDFLQWVEQQSSPIVAIESAILFESGFCHLAHHIVNVTAPLPLRISRTMQRDACTAQQVERRIQLQLADEQRSSRSQYLIVNDGRDLSTQIERILSSLNGI